MIVSIENVNDGKQLRILGSMIHANNSNERTPLVFTSTIQCEGDEPRYIPYFMSLITVPLDVKK